MENQNVIIEKKSELSLVSLKGIAIFTRIFFENIMYVFKCQYIIQKTFPVNSHHLILR